MTPYVFVLYTHYELNPLKITVFIYVTFSATGVLHIIVLYMI